MVHAKYWLMPAFIVVSILTLGASPSLADSAPAAGSFTGVFNSMGPGGASVNVTLTGEPKALDLTFADTTLRAAFADAVKNDAVTITTDSASNPTQITAVASVARPVGRTERVIFLALSGVILVAIAAAVTKFRPQSLLISKDNRYSNSQCQLALWFGAVATVYVASVGLRIHVLGWDFIGGVNLPQNLIALTGLSAFTFGAAKVITVTKLQQAGMLQKTPAAQPNLLTDLFQNDNKQADLGDFQMILVVVAAVLLFLISSFHFLGMLTLTPQVTLPDVDTALLSGFGLGQGAYLVKNTMQSVS